ncbi:MAG: putative zinc-binding peptidase [Cellulomonas sp.]|nr:putative zinc-binding peptidase [Cellulomonas sp.]
MRLLRCPSCGFPAWLESLECRACGAPMMLATSTLSMVEVPGAVDDHGTPLVACVNRSWGCNWSLRADHPATACFSCRLTRRRPDADDTVALERLAETGKAKRRLLVGLADLGLPVEPYWLVDGGLAFDLLSSQSGRGPVVIGHAGGVITIDLAESLDALREQLRVTLGEPYRTMLGHFRHEVGHYYQWQLVERPAGSLLDECREVFGDERASYADALTQHYASGAPAGWETGFISEYATMHPWEDFAETFAHYQHILDTLGTVAHGGLRIDASALLGSRSQDVVPRTSYADVPMAVALEDWQWVSYELNRANRAMGKGDLYPFTIPVAVGRKLDLVHRIVTSYAVPVPFVGD